MDSQIIVGTAKELVAFSLMKNFDLSKISMAVFDEADLMCTTNLVENEIIAKLSERCQKVFVSATLNRSSIRVMGLQNPFHIHEQQKVPDNILHFGIRCENALEKIKIVEMMCRKIVMSDNWIQAMIFCNVRLKYFIIKFWFGYNFDKISDTTEC